MSTLILIAAAVSMLALAIVALGILFLSIRGLKPAFADKLALPSAGIYMAGDERIQVMPGVA